MDPTVTVAWIGDGAAIMSDGWIVPVAIATNRNARRTESSEQIIRKVRADQGSSR
jgi:hypothetical protein